MHGDNFMPMSGSAGSAPKINNNSFNHSDGLFMQHSSHLVSSLNEGLGSISPDLRWVWFTLNVHSFHSFNFRINFDARISEMNQLNSDQQMLNNSTTPSNSLFDGHMQKYPISPMMNSSFNAREDSMRNNFELWKMDMERKVCLSHLLRESLTNLIIFFMAGRNDREAAWRSIKHSEMSQR